MPTEEEKIGRRVLGELTDQPFLSLIDESLDGQLSTQEGILRYREAAYKKLKQQLHEEKIAEAVKRRLLS